MGLGIENLKLSAAKWSFLLYYGNMQWKLRVKPNTDHSNLSLLCMENFQKIIFKSTFQIKDFIILWQRHGSLVGTGNQATKFGRATAAKCSWEAVRMKDEVSFECKSMKQNTKKLGGVYTISTWPTESRKDVPMI